MSAGNDPLLQPFRLRHLTLRNRIMVTAHEPAYAEDGMPKARYRAYHVARAKGGVALTMTAGSASVSRDSPPAFNNILAWKDEVVPHMRDLVDACHEHGAAVMIQLTHLGRRTRWDAGDWLPVISSSDRREPAHRAVPKRMEDWDIARVVRDYAECGRADAGGRCRRHRARGLWPPSRPGILPAHQRSRSPLERRPRRQAALHIRSAGRDPGARRPRLHHGRARDWG